MHKYIWPLVLVMWVTAASGCARDSRQASSEAVQINLTTIPYPPILGKSNLIIQVADNEGAPVNDALLDIKGDMTHAGMIPILAQVSGGGEDGYYEVPIEWTMGGDWILNVEATLPDGTKAKKQFDFRVTLGDDELCGEGLTGE